jgi:predicted branched-subunit amino acid permease
MPEASSLKSHYGRRGFLDALVLVIPAIPFALVFGLAVRESGLAIWLGWSSSPIMFSGAAQITLITLLGEGASVAAAATAALVVGARHLFYSFSMAPVMQRQPVWFRWLAPYMLVDQVFALCVSKQNLPTADFRHYYLAAGITFWMFWMTFTAVGLFVGPVIPAGLDITFATPVLFMGLLVTAIDSWQKAVVAVFAMLVTFILADMPSRSGLLIAVLAGLILGLVLERLRK